jgi:elongation factor 1-alpha
MTDGKQHVSIVICGHVDAGKSTTTGRLIFELGGIEQREMDKLKAEADAVGKSSFAFAFYMDRQKEERERGVTIACTTKEFFTESKHYTVIDAPGHRDFIKNMITGASQADVALLMVPSDGNFTAAIAKGDHKAGVVQGQTRQHAVLINLLGVKQLIVGVNKMDCDVAGYKQARYDEIKNEMTFMLIKSGWKKKFVEESVPILPISGWMGDNLITKSTNMDWWKGVDVKVDDETIHLDTLKEALEKMVRVPVRDTTKPMRTPISGVFKIKGVGDVITGRVEQGTVKPGDEVVFIPTHTAANPCPGNNFTVEMHHKSVEAAHPGELKAGYCPIAFVRTGRSACRMSEIKWKIGKSTGGAKAENPTTLKSSEVAEIVMQPQQPFVVDTFKACEGLGRIAIMEGNSVVMLGKVTKVSAKAGK